MRASADATHARLGGPGQWLLALPPSYVAGLQVLFRSVRAGTEPVEDVADLTRRRGATSRWCRPSWCRMLETDAPRCGVRHRAGRRRPARPAAAASGPSRRGSGWSTTYGMSETCGGCVYDGRPLDGVEVATATTVASGSAGRCCSTGTTGEPGADRAACCEDGWFVTQDLGRDRRTTALLHRPGPGRRRGGLRGRQRAAGGGRAAAARAPGRARGRGGRRARRRSGASGSSRCVVGDLDLRRGRGTGWRASIRGPGRRAASYPSTTLPLLPNGKVDRLAVERLAPWLRRGLLDPDAHPLPRASRCARGCCCAATPGGASSARSWSTTPRSPSPGCAPPVRPPTRAGRRRCATSVPVNVTVPAVGPEQAAAIVRASGGCRTAKVKVGRARPDPRRRAGPARGGARRPRPRRPDPHRRQRAAGRSTRRCARIPLLDRAAGGLEYVEQPCAAVEDLAVVRRRVDVPVAADESIRRAEDPYRVRDLEAADVAVLKVQPLGGVRACLRIAEDIGLPVVVSSALETSVGHRRRGRAGGGASRSCPTPAAWRRCSCSPTTSPSTRCCRATARCPSYARRSTRPRSPAPRAAPERERTGASGSRR